MGLANFVRYLINGVKVFAYYLDGFENLSLEVKGMVVPVAASAQVSEAPLKIIMKDDRMALRITDVDAALA